MENEGYNGGAVTLDGGSTLYLSVNGSGVSHLWETMPTTTVVQYTIRMITLSTFFYGILTTVVLG